MKKLIPVLGVMAAFAVSAAITEPSALRAKEQLQRFCPDAAKRFLADMKGNPKYDYAKHAPAVEKLIAELDQVKAALEGNDKAKQDAAVATYEAYRAAMLANPILDFDKILCVRRIVKNPRGAMSGRGIGFQGINAHNHWDMNRVGYNNDIVVLSNLRGKQEFKSLYRPTNTSLVRDLDLDYDASRIMFTAYRGTNSLFGVYEIPASGSDKPVEVSPSEHLDIQWWDACYLPNKDQVAFLGTGAYQYLPCENGNMPMAVIYRKDRKTGEVRQLTYEQDSDYTPSVTHDGRIMFTRWEYSDLPHYFTRILMTMNPDGIGQLALWGSGSYVPTFFYNARSVPGDPHKITMFGGGHHARGEVGRMFMIDPTLARAYPFKYDAPDRSWGPIKHVLRIPAQTFPKEKTGMVQEFPGWGKDVEGDVCDPYVENQFARGKPYFAFPYPLSEKYHLATLKSNPGMLMGIYLVDVFDNMTLIAEIDDGLLVEAMPFTPRKRPPVIPDRSVPGKKTCSVHIADIYVGPGLAGIPRGTVKKLRLFSYHYNYHKTGGHASVGLDGVESSWDVKRILGTVDVEDDGSACFEMPANTPISIQPLDAEGRAVQLMRSWVVGMPGERVSCTGCHEDNRTSIQTKQTIADKKYFKGQIQKIKPVDADGVRPWGFENEMWPVVQKYCLTCHGDPKTAPIAKADQGGAENKGVRICMTDAQSAYRKLHPYVRRPGPESENTVLTPMSYHASTSPLVQILKKGHHGVCLDDAAYRIIYQWIDLNAPWRGKWDPKPFQTDKFVQGVTNQIARRLDLSIQYANIHDDPEKEYDVYAAKLQQRGAPKPVMAGKKQVRDQKIELKGWPMDINQSANAQLGAINQIAPVTTRTIILGNGQSMTFRRIPAGKFIMGSATGYNDEYPRTIVEIEKPFWISEMEVRNDQYNVFDPDHDSGYQDQFGKDHVVPGYVGNHRRMPVVRVTWNEANEFCKWLSKTAGVKAKLPTEAQWEWAARAGTDTPFPWGGLDDDFSKFANFADKDVRFMRVGWNGAGAVRKRGPFSIASNYPLHEERWQDDWFTINYVGRADCNIWGLYDMHGNAAEWTRSDYKAYPYSETDGRNDCKNCMSKKVVRGGSFASRPRDATSSVRLGYEPWQKVFDVGFRVIIEE